MIALPRIDEIGFELVLHPPPYFPDLALSNYHLFTKLKKNLNGKKTCSINIEGILAE